MSNQVMEAGLAKLASICRANRESGSFGSLDAEAVIEAMFDVACASQADAEKAMEVVRSFHLCNASQAKQALVKAALLADVKEPRRRGGGRAALTALKALV